MKILKYKADGQTAILGNKELEKIDKNLFFYEEKDEYGYVSYYYFLKCKNEIFYPICRKRNEMLSQELVEKYKNYNEDIVFQCIANKEKNCLFISNIDILFCELMDREELAKHYFDYRKKYIEEQKERIKKEEEIEKQKQLEKIELEKMKKLELLEKAKNDFMNGLSIEAEEFEMLCKEYNISIPMKVAGWLREHCSSISARKWDTEEFMKRYGHIPNFTNKYDVRFYHTKGHSSKIFASIIDKLAIAMNL